jgi:hypothetical protein
VRIVIDSQWRAILQDDAPGALDLHREQVRRIPDPTNLKLLAVEGTRFNGGPVVEGDEMAVGVGAADMSAFVGEGTGPGLSAGDQQVRRSAINRDMEFRTGKPRPLNDRLIVTGQ